MGDTGHVHLFGDQTNDFVPGLRQLLRIRDSPLLRSFLEKTHVALRQELSRQRRDVQDLLPSFANIFDLFASYTPESDSSPLLASTLTAIYQLGSYIRCYGDGWQPYPSGPDHVVLGMCTGQLAASAVASASTAGELVHLAVETVVIAFKTGLHVMRVRDLLSSGEERCQSWSCVVSKLSVEDARSRIEHFSESNSLPLAMQPFVGTVSLSGVSIFGHPTILKDFFASPIMCDVKLVHVPVFAPYHNPSLYGESDILEILENLDKDIAARTAKLPIISSVTGVPVHANTFGGLLHASLEEILRQPLRLDQMLQSMMATCSSSPYTRWIISSVSTTSSQIFASALRQVEGISVELELQTNLTSSSSQKSTSGRPEHSRIAVIGYSGRFPESPNPEALWKLLKEGRDTNREIPPDRYDVDAHYDPTGKKKNTSTIRQGCFINEPGVFDARFFNLSPKEADQADPAQRLALMATYEAMEMAGVVPDRTPSTKRDRVGVFHGMTSDDWRDVNQGQDIGTYYIPGGNRAFFPGRVNYFFKFTGPSVCCDTACSSSAAAIHLACNSLWRNDCDMAIANGTNVMTSPECWAGLDKGHFLCQSGNCKTFDDGADGYCRADAVGSVILKRLEDALADKDPIQAVICGAYTNHSAESESITRPHIGAQVNILRRILNDSGHDPLDVSYVEMHGTGTQAGDAVEMRSVLEVFTGSRSGRSGQPLYLGSVKANVGHSESGSGVTSLIKVMMMMKYSEIPPHIGIKTKINSGFPKDLYQRGIRIAMEATPWRQPANRRRMAVVNNFSAAGGNSALLVEDAPAAIAPLTSEDVRSSHVITVSARSASLLSSNVERLAAHLETNPDVSLGSLSYTTTARRVHHQFRISVTGRTIADVKSALQRSVGLAVQAIPRKTPQVAFAFTGQGAVYQGMGKQLFTSFSVFRDEVRRLDRICQSFGFDSFMPVLNGDADNYTISPQASQLSLLCCEIALAKLWQSMGVFPSVVVGHSLGEYAALCIAGVLSARDAVFLVGTRAHIMQQRCSAGTHAMLAVRAAASTLSQVMEDHRLEIACINGPEQTVLAGLLVDVERAGAALMASGTRATKLATDFAFHSSQVEPVVDEFEKAARGVLFKNPTIPVISPLLAGVVTDGNQFSPQYLGRHCREMVNFLGAIKSAMAQKVISEDTICLEIGPDPVVSGMLKATVGSSTRTVVSVRKSDGLWATLTEALSNLYQFGLDIQWGEYHRDYDAFHEVIVLPAYAWDLKNHWIQYVNNWVLRKGDALPAPLPAPPVAEPPKFLSATCQKVIESEHGPDRSFVLIESDISHPDLRAVFEAHKVNGAALCPSSAMADIAITLGNYLLEDNPVKSNEAIEVADMASVKPLIMRTPGKTELFRASAEADWTTQTAKVVFFSVNSRGESTTEHGSCTLRFGNFDQWASEWKRTAHLVRSRMQSLRNEAHGGNCHLIKRGMAYKLFANCVEYGEKFQGLEEVYLDSKEHEATARVVLKDKSTCFEGNPYHLDSLGHLSGFIMNATESFDYKTQVFLNHGWESSRCIKASPEQTYNTYVKMETTDGSHYAGDVYIFQGDEIVGVTRGVAFKSVPRKVLDFLLPSSAMKANTKITPQAHVAPTARLSSLQRAAISQPEKARPKASALEPPKMEAVAKPMQFVQAMTIISEETGIPVAEMKNDLVLADMGVDSLLSLTVCSRLREELDMEVSSTLFMEYPTVSDLKRWLGATSDPVHDSDDGSKISTPLSGFSGDGDSDSISVVTSVEGDKPQSSDGTHKKMSEICNIIAEEIGVTEEEVWSAPSLAEMGLDSLMSLTVLGRLREEADLDLPMDIMFTDNMASIQQKLFGDSPEPEKPLPVVTVSKPTKSAVAPVSVPVATSVLLQGSLKTARKVLFLFPDGSGSATTYGPIPRIASDVAVVALNCPFMRRPQDFKCALQDLTAPYLAEVRRRQPHGPYYVGGWSAGGICAYDAAQKLMASGEEVAALILLDSPNPTHLEKLPHRLFDFLNGCGIFGSGGAHGEEPPEWLLPHFVAFIDALFLYDMKPFPRGKTPQTYALWAGDGVYKSTDKRLVEQPDDTREMKWMLHHRTEYGPNGWDSVIEQNKMTMEVLEGANHFTMMQGPQGQKLSQFLARAMGSMM
ncbi:polyketide synthase for naphthopyrone YWA1 [Hypoxylon sp. FL0890]|nr:polyketide synthase for naphthopyrone YWA1 [Hypoxylon sp. FL0890]